MVEHTVCLLLHAILFILQTTKFISNSFALIKYTIHLMVVVWWWWVETRFMAFERAAMVVGIKRKYADVSPLPGYSQTSTAHQPVRVYSQSFIHPSIRIPIYPKAIIAASSST